MQLLIRTIKNVCYEQKLSPVQLRFLVPPYPLVQPVLHLFKKMRVADGFPAFDVGVMAVTVLGFHAEKRVEHQCKLFQWDFTVIDAAHLMDAVYHLHQVDGVARPAQGMCDGRRPGWLVGGG